MSFGANVAVIVSSTILAVAGLYHMLGIFFYSREEGTVICTEMKALREDVRRVDEKLDRLREKP
jgi:hypothetical protein